MTTSPTTDAARAASVQQKTEELVTRARGMHDLIRAQASAGEENRRVTDEVIQAAEEAGLFDIAKPKRFGGFELPIRSFLSIHAAIAEADGSTAWVLTLSNVCAWLTSLYPDRVQQEIFGADPATRVCGVVAPNSTAVREEGGLRVSGKWAFASASHHAQWALLGVPVVDDDGVMIDHGLAAIPMSDLTIEDTWHVVGMQGTGSNTLVADEVFVPDYRIMSVSQAINGVYPTEHTDEALYRSAFVPVLAIVLAAPLAGMARGAYGIVRGSLDKGRGISYTFYEKAIDATSIQIGMAQAAEWLDSMDLHLMRAADTIDAAAAGGEYPGALERAQARMDTGHIAVLARQTLDTLLSVNGAGSFAKANPLQRIWRDVNTASRHAVVSSAMSTEVYGRELLGGESPISPLV